MDSPDALRVAIVGQTGSGKSALANSLSGKNSFLSRLSSKETTKTCEVEFSERFGKKIVVVDTPGLFDTSVTDSTVTKEILKCISMTSPGPHVFLFVLAIGRFTKDIQTMMELFVERFGKEIMNFTILIFSRLDDLDNAGMTFEQYISEAPQALQNILRTFEYIPLNCISKDDFMIKKLFEVMETSIDRNKGQYYTKENFETAMKVSQNKQTTTIGEGNAILENIIPVIKPFQDELNRLSKVYQLLKAENQELRHQAGEAKENLNDTIIKSLRLRRTRGNLLLIDKLLSDDVVCQPGLLSDSIHQLLAEKCRSHYRAPKRTHIENNNTKFSVSPLKRKRVSE